MEALSPSKNYGILIEMSMGISHVDKMVPCVRY